MLHYPMYVCEEHGPVVGYVPFEYREEGGHEYKYGPFCPLCISEWHKKTFATLKPVSTSGASRA